MAEYYKLASVSAFECILHVAAAHIMVLSSMSCISESSQVALELSLVINWICRSSNTEDSFKANHD